MTEESMRDLLIEIKTKLDIALGHLSDHEGRLRDLERTKWLMVGAAAAVGGAAGKLVGLL
jgi:hypothetical protein